MAITGIRIHGFKCFRDRTEVEIRPLTVLAGRNSSGKSSLLQPLLLLKQTLEAPYDSDPLLLNGSLVRVLESRDLFWRSQQQEAQTWSISIRDEEDWTGNEYSRRDGVFHLEETFGQHGELTWRLKQDGTYFPSELEDRIRREGMSWAGFDVKATPGRGGFYFGAASPNHTFRSVYGFHPAAFRDIIHLPGLRGNPERFYPITRVANHFPGPFNDHTASVLANWQDQDDERVLQVGEDLRSLGLTWKVHAKRLDDARLELKVGRLPSKPGVGEGDMVNIVDVGLGASQVLPVLVALHAAKQGQLVHIEQPELHLHPNAQVAMAGLLVNAAKRGVQVVVETHSSVLLTALQVAVARGELNDNELALHWFSRDADGAASVRTANLEKTGIYGDWPVDFAEVEMDIEAAFIEAAAR